MEKPRSSSGRRSGHIKFDLSMKLSTLFLFAGLFAMQANSYSQRTKITLEMKDVTVEEALEHIENTTDFRFTYRIDDVDLDRTVSVNVRNKKIARVLKILFGDTGTDYRVYDTQIMLIERTPNAADTIAVAVPPGKPDIQEQITGTVTDSEGVPLPGASVVEKGTSNGTTTDFDGIFSITLENADAVLEVSYIGYVVKEIPVGEQTEIDVTLQPDTAELDEVVVIGYGTRDRKDLTGAVSTVQSESIAEQPITSVEQSLSGQVSGVQLRQNGAPGSGPEILVRGVASTGNNNAPLYVVDGIPLGNVNSQRDNFVLNSIAPSSIESISVLKDASSKAIYGSRASNGVIIITTKQGKKGKPRITFGTSTGFQTVPDFERPQVLNAEQLRRFRIESLEDRQFAIGALGQGEIVELDRLINLGNLGEGTDWFDEITKSAPISQYDINVSGGSENVRYNVSTNYTNQDGILLSTNFKRYSLRANIDIDISDNLRFGLNLAPTQTVATGGRTDAGDRNFDIFAAVPLSRWTDPSAPVFRDNGTLTNVANGDLIEFYNVNPVYLLRGREDNRRVNQILAGSFIEVDILKDLTFKTFGSIQYIDRRNTSFEPSDFPADGALTPNLQGTGQARAGIQERTNFNWIWENTLTYTKTLGDDHRLDVLAGFTMENRRSENTIINAKNLIDESIKVPDSDNVDPEDITNFTGQGEVGENSLVSMIGRLDYAYKNLYYLTGTIRRDGSSKFGADTRYGNFPSIALAWRVGNEAFFEGLSETISELKLEGGYGISGSNANIDNFQAQGQITQGPNYVFGGAIAPGSAISALPNPLITWEEAKELNFGLDIGLWNDKIYLSADYYDIETDGFLSGLPIPTTSGFGTILTNLGSIENKGIELELKLQNVLGGENFQWDANFNYTRNRSKVLELAAESGFIRRGAIARQFTETREGEQVGLYRGFNVTGLFTQAEIDNPDVPKYPGAVEGSLKFEDGDGDGILGDQEDFVIIGNPNADFTYGMVHNFRYKNLDLSMVFTGSIGQQIFNGTNQFNGNQDGVFNVDTRQLDRWRPGDDPSQRTIPGTASEQSRQRFRIPNSLSVDDADYLWVRNITLGFNLDGETIGNFFANARVYTSIQNPFLFTEYEFGNPEVNRSGDTALVRNVNYGSYPVSRIITLGLNLTF